MALKELAAGWVVFDFPLAELTTYRLGGPAWALVEPENVDDLAAMVRFLEQKGLPWMVLGGGTNVLFRDGGFPGVVVRLGLGFGELGLGPEEAGTREVTAGASVRTPQLLALTRREGLSGLECLAGIPGWVGGAVAGNAGTRDRAIGDAVETLEYLSREGELVRLAKRDLRTSYRRLDLPAGAVVVRALFRLMVDDPSAVEARVRDLLDRRIAGQPHGVRCAGCVFKNPPGDYAGRLIDQAGLKGVSAGKAWISDKHANFIVHRGKATTSQVLELVETARRTVKDRFGVELETEIKILGVDREEGTE